MDKGPFMIIRNTVSALLLIVIMGVNAQADTVALTPDYPNRYVVVKGDTLWDIAARFLRDPWKWPDVWELNPQIENPNLIYPGDVISLVFRNGKPVLQVERGPAVESNVVKLEPEVRVTTLERPIPTLPTDAIEQFLLKAQVISPEESKNSGYIVSMEEERLIGGTGNKIYARHLQQHPGGRFEVVRVGRVYHNPGASKKEVLGYEALHIADARVDAYGDPSTLTLLKASREALIGDRIIPAQDETAINYNFLPRAPDRQIRGKIIALFDAVSRVGQYQVVVLNQGLNDGLQPGHVLAVYHAGDTVRDTVADKGTEVTLPDTRSGLLMVFRVFDKVSYGLVMTAHRDIHLYDMIRNP
jgi:LysM domain